MLRRFLLQHPWKLDGTSADYLVTASIGMMRDALPPLPASSAPGDR
ncbi:hypothetical protein [Saccharothrix deserti]|nr:hypothetical protein [Saccharothrix deserti]